MFTEFITSWLKELVTLFMIISLIDIVMPKGNMKRYVNFIIGILIIFTVISPLTKVNDISLDIDREVEAFSQKDISMENLEEVQNQQIVDLYLSSLRKELKDLIEDNSDYVVETIEFKTSPNEDHIISLEGVDIIMVKQEIKGDIRVEDIDIGDKSTVLTSIEDDDIKGVISTMIQLEKNKINIYYGEESYGGTNQ
ncbi:hypothetical protein E9840_00905 [Tissierella creatinini]|nr:hypothetical protein E9840_00905 [Tissierella creatinini]TJX69090.1 hypothetical protein E8P77_00215 [Soehngenia saccharolytica]